MPYILLPHVRVRMRERRISLARVEAVLNSPDQIVPGKDGRNIYQSKYTARGGKEMLLRLVVEDTGPITVVISVYPADDVSRYWRS